MWVMSIRCGSCSADVQLQLAKYLEEGAEVDDFFAVTNAVILLADPVERPQQHVRELGADAQAWTELSFFCTA